jgi:hypothetical protein
VEWHQMPLQWISLYGNNITKLSPQWNDIVKYEVRNH